MFGNCDLGRHELLALTGFQITCIYGYWWAFWHELAQNGVRGLMLDMYDFDNDIWLCHSFGAKCYNYTAFVSFHEPVM